MSEHKENRPAEHEKKKLTQAELINQTAKATAREMLRQQRQAQKVNFYRSMERLLRAYPKRVHLMEHPEEFEFFPTGRSKSISIAPPPGTGVVDKVDVAELFIEARKRGFEHEMFRLYETEYAIAPYRDLPEFIIIRMLYWNEDVHGHEREAGAKRWSLEEIQEELSSVGLKYNIKTVRAWRTKLVQDMTVMLFGVDGAISVESRDSEPGGKAGDADVGIRREE